MVGKELIHSADWSSSQQLFSSSSNEHWSIEVFAVRCGTFFTAGNTSWQNTVPLGIGSTCRVNCNRNWTSCLLILLSLKVLLGHLGIVRSLSTLTFAELDTGADTFEIERAPGFSVTIHRPLESSSAYNLSIALSSLDMNYPTYVITINSFPLNDTIWCHHGHGLSISQWEFVWGV